jgi:hypothetical protein
MVVQLTCLCGCKMMIQLGGEVCWDSTQDGNINSLSKKFAGSFQVSIAHQSGSESTHVSTGGIPDGLVSESR